jgi:ribose/xylose/arabinose/galactoside ABC-type transport system permease subunit
VTLDASTKNPTAPRPPKGVWLREAGVFIAFLVLCGLITLTGARAAFLSSGNLQNLSRQIAFLGVFTLGEAIVIIAGGIDLSVGSLIGFVGMVCARMFAEWHWPLGVAILAALSVSLVIGIVQAALIHYLRVPPFIVTLGALSIFRSLAQLMSNAMPIPTVGESLDSRLLDYLVSGRILGIPVSVCLLAVLLILLELLMRRSRMGRYLYALGSNEEAARLSGVRIFPVKAVAYGLSALLAGVAGVLYVGYNGQGDPRSGYGYELNAIAAAVVGGCSLAGGQGTLLGSVLGAGILNVILNGINLIIQRNASLWEGTIVGSVVILAVLLNVIARRREQ